MDPQLLFNLLVFRTCATIIGYRHFYLLFLARSLRRTANPQVLRDDPSPLPQATLARHPNCFCLRQGGRENERDITCICFSRQGCDTLSYRERILIFSNQWRSKSKPSLLEKSEVSRCATQHGSVYIRVENVSCTRGVQHDCQTFSYQQKQHCLSSSRQTTGESP